MIPLIPSPQLSPSTLKQMHDYRLARVRQAMAEQNISLCVLANPISLRYAIDFDEYQLFQSHIPSCYLFVPIEGPLVMHGATRQDFANVDEYRRPRFVTPFDGGLDITERSKLFASDVDDFVRQNTLADKGAKIAIEKLSPSSIQALEALNYQVKDADCIIEKAKCIKSTTEIECIRHAIAVTEFGMRLMQEQTEPGLTERQLWSILHQVNVANNGCWLEGHMLSSGPRTNPWLQEATERVIQVGDMIAFDTDLIGPRGYMADISRSWICGGGRGTEAQREAYQHAYEEVHFNIDIIKPGMCFLNWLKKPSSVKRFISIITMYVCITAQAYQMSTPKYTIKMTGIRMATTA